MNRKQATEHMRRVRMLPCIACGIEGVRQPNPTEAHHCNFNGKAGQPRRGDEFVLPLCQHHHRGVPKVGMTSIDMAETYGPSLAKSSRRFRERYGTDDFLLAKVEAMLNNSRVA